MKDLPQGTTKSHLRTSLISLLEKYGEEVINRLQEDVETVLESDVVKKGSATSECISGVFENERTKLKEILSSLK